MKRIIIKNANPSFIEAVKRELDDKKARHERLFNKARQMVLDKNMKPEKTS